MVVEETPFNMVFNRLWEMAETSVPLAELVRVGNRIKFNQDTNRDPIKQNVNNADLPELTLVMTGGADPNLHFNSCASAISRTFSWALATGDFRYTYLLGPVEFAIMSAMANWQTELSGLTWRGELFVKDCNITDLSTGFTNQESNRGIKGWSAVWSCVVKMMFTTQKLKDFHLGVAYPPVP